MVQSLWQASVLNRKNPELLVNKLSLFAPHTSSNL
jgi:hypothetical protein